jgi:hypothetical protein
MYSNQSWPPVISSLGVYLCFRNAMRTKQGYCRGWQGHIDIVSIESPYRSITLARLPSKLSLTSVANMDKVIDPDKQTAG